MTAPIRLPAALPVLLLALMAAGCASVPGERGGGPDEPRAETRPEAREGRFAKAGMQDRQGRFTPQRGFTRPAGFKLSPAEVARKYGRLCKPKKLCSYFADERNYYLVADHAPGSDIARVACPVVSGLNGTLLRIC